MTTTDNLLNSVDTLNEQYDTWYRDFHNRVHVWTGDCGVRAAEVVLKLPYLVELMLNLGSDSRLSDDTRRDFQTKAASIMRGIEFLPDNSASIVPLSQDSLKAAKTLEVHYHQISGDVLDTHWRSSEDLSRTIHYVVHEQDDWSPRC